MTREIIYSNALTVDVTRENTHANTFAVDMTSEVIHDNALAVHVNNNAVDNNAKGVFDPQTRHVSRGAGLEAECLPPTRGELGN